MANVGGVVLVEGPSDQAALEALAIRSGRNLEAEGVSIIPMGGASALPSFLDELRSSAGSTSSVAGLCDEGEIDDYRRALEQAGFGTKLSRSDMESLGFYICVTDLEDELIRSLGVAVVESVLEAQGELRSFRTFQHQPAWRAKPTADQMRRFIGTRSGRKIRYGRLLVDALDLTQVPRPLERVLSHV